MIKEQKVTKTPLTKSQKNPVDTTRKNTTSVDYYNRFIRKEGQRVLSQEEYSKMMKDAGNKPG